MGDEVLVSFPDVLKLLEDYPVPHIFWGLAFFCFILMIVRIFQKKEAFDKWPSFREPTFLLCIFGSVFLFLNYIMILLIDGLLKEAFGPLLMAVFALITFFGAFIIKKRLRELIEAEEQLVAKVEDATRRVLDGFPEIYERALRMLKEAEREIWYVNFIVRFGAPHCYNSVLTSRYKGKTGNALCGDEDDVLKAAKAAVSSSSANEKTQLYHFGDVDTFYDNLCDKVKQVKNVNIITLDDEAAWSKFIEPLSNKSGYENLKKCCSDRDSVIMKIIADDNKYFRFDIFNAKQGTARTNYKVNAAATLPIQLLITGLPSHKGTTEDRFGCLVFMVGTDTRGSIDPGDESGFYTELEQVVTVYKKVAKALMKEATPVTGQQTIPG